MLEPMTWFQPFLVRQDSWLGKNNHFTLLSLMGNSHDLFYVMCIWNLPLTDHLIYTLHFAKTDCYLSIGIICTMNWAPIAYSISAVWCMYHQLTYWRKTCHLLTHFKTNTLWNFLPFSDSVATAVAAQFNHWISKIYCFR